MPGSQQEGSRADSDRPVRALSPRTPGLAGVRKALLQWTFEVFEGDFSIMAKSCEVCGRGPQFGHRISHAHNVTKRRWNLNLQTVRALVKGASRRVKVCTSCIKSGKIQKAA